MTSASQLEALVFTGESPFAERLRVQVRRIAPYYRTALILGEQGTGKQDVARELHRLSPVAGGPFLACNAEEFAAGSVEPIRFGTIYLEHLGALLPPAQEQLLRRLQRQDMRPDARPGCETRLIVADEAPLRGMVASGRLRQDLYARIGTIEIRLPRLRDRLEDLPFMLAGLNVTPAALLHLRDHPWPGNLRGLREVLVQAQLAARGRSIEPCHLPIPTAAQSAAQLPSDARLDFVMKRHVTEVLERCAGNKLRAAEMLGISRSTLYRMLDSPAAEA
jgi:DNA-binding NtrC family response regulator